MPITMIDKSSPMKRRIICSIDAVGNVSCKEYEGLPLCIMSAAQSRLPQSNCVWSRKWAGEKPFSTNTFRTAHTCTGVKGEIIASRLSSSPHQRVIEIPLSNAVEGCIQR